MRLRPPRGVGMRVRQPAGNSRLSTPRWGLGADVLSGALIVGVLLVGGAGVADAHWLTEGSGPGVARVGTLKAPSDVNATLDGSAVAVAWTASGIQTGAVTGYYVHRVSGATTVPACGTDGDDASTFLTASAVSCLDVLIPNGMYTYVVTAALNSWTATSVPSAPIIVSAPLPDQELSLTASSNAALVADVVYYRGTVAGSFRIVSTVTSTTATPASAAFPAIAATGWTHPGQTVTDGTGTNPVTYASTPYSWTANPANPSSQTITVTDTATNSSSARVSFTQDTAAPVGGSLVVNTTSASTAGTSSSSNVGSFAIDNRTEWTDAASGIATSTLTVQSAALTTSTCGSYGVPSTILATPLQSGLATGCYRYTLTGIDNVGNAASVQTTVKVDTTVPTGGAVTVNATPASAMGTASFVKSGSTVIINSRTDYTDAQSGMQSSTLTTRNAPLANGVCGAYSGPATIVGTTIQTVASGTCYQYSLTGIDNAGNARAIWTVVRVDAVAPSQVLTLTSATGAWLTGTVIYVKTNAPGSFSWNSTVTDIASGPASALFPAIATTGWTHPIQTVAVGSGVPPTTAYTSSTVSWTAGASLPGTATIIVADQATNTRSTAYSFTQDTTAPIGGALNVNGGATGATTFNKTGAYAIGTRTDYTDAGSGIATSKLTLQNATLTNNACGTYGATSTLVGSPPQSGLATGCYLYTMTGMDNVGNTVSINTTVKVDIEVPVGGAVTVNGAPTSPTGSASYLNAGTVVIISARTDYTDAQSGLGTSTMTSRYASLANNTCGTYGTASTITGTTSQIVSSGRCYLYSLTGTDRAGNAVAVTTTVKVDTVAPSGGALTVNVVAASTAGTSSSSKTGTYPIGARTDYTDAVSGLASSTLTVQAAPWIPSACGTFADPSTITGSPAQTALTSACYLYTLTGTDNAGKQSAIKTNVKVDVDAPVGGAATINGTAAATVGTTSYLITGTVAVINARADYTDAQSGMASSMLTTKSATLASNVCGAYGGATTIPLTPDQVVASGRCYLYTLTGTDVLGNLSPITTTVKVDTTGPTGGSLTVNGVAASLSGTTSIAPGSSFTIGTRTDYTDAASGLASSTLTRSTAPLTGSTCGAFDTAAEIAGAPAQAGMPAGCYQYVLTGIDNAGTSTSISTVVQQHPYVISVALVNGSGTPGTVDTGDRITITYNESMSVGSMCSDWSGDGSDQAITGANQVTVTVTQNAKIDPLTVTSTACTLNFGSLTTGGNYVTATSVFTGAGAGASTIAWSASTSTLTITLGAMPSGAVANVASSSAVYTPSGVQQNPAAVPILGSFTAEAGQKF